MRRFQHPFGHRFALLGALLVASMLLLAGCGRSEDPPPTNPLQPTTEATSTASGETPSGTVVTGDPGGGPDAEAAAAQAVALMAEWLGVPATNFSVLAVEAVEWPDSCLGAAFPDEACDDVLTPGWKVLLLDAVDGAHTVHLGTGGAARWAGEYAGDGTLVSLDLAARSMRLALPNDEVELRLAPGTRLDDGLELDTLEAGDHVFFGADTPVDGSSVIVAAWLFLGE
ncbi:MAG: hypothetical protein R3C39_04720 [Dehalococcoidia bacterium]